MMDFASPPHRRSLLDVANAIARLKSGSRKRVIHPYVDSLPGNGNLDGPIIMVATRLRSSFPRFSLVENSSLFLLANDPRRTLTPAAQTLRGRESRIHLQRRNSKYFLHGHIGRNQALRITDRVNIQLSTTQL